MPGLSGDVRATGPPGGVAGDGAAAKRVAALAVLVVEDNEDAGTTLADLLALFGHEVRLASTGRAGVAAAAERLPDVLVCDLGLPDLSGHDVVRAVRAAPGGARVFAIALSGYARPQDRQASLDAGFDAHLAKPAPLDALRALLGEAARRAS